MKILVRQEVTNQFLSDLGRWVPDEAEAMSFPNRTSAFLFCIRFYISGVQVVVHHDDGHWERA
ncbi:MAG TPA: hypothetical protein VGH19_13080 [Verrucomicrobiae bacterium]